MKLNIMTKITVAFAAVVIVFGLVMIYVSHQNSEREKKNTVQLYEERGVAIAQALDASVTSEQQLASSAQSLVDKVGKSGLGIEEFNIYAKAPEGKSPTGFWVIGTNDPALQSKPADPEDLDAVKTNEHNVLFAVEDGKRIIDVTYPLHDASGKAIATAGLKFDMSAVDKLTVSSSTYLVTLVMIVLGVVVAIVVSYTITSPLRKLTAVTSQLDKLAAGNVDIALPVIKSRDEIYDLNESLKGVVAAFQFLTDELDNASKKAAV